MQRLFEFIGHHPYLAAGAVFAAVVVVFYEVRERVQAFAALSAVQAVRLMNQGALVVDLRAKDANLTGAEVEKALEAAGIISNKNGIPNDPRPPKVTSGLRLGTPAITTRGLKEADMETVADFIDRAVVRMRWRTPPSDPRCRFR